MRVWAWLGVVALPCCVLTHQLAAQDPGVTRTGLDSLRRAEGLRVRVLGINADGWQTGTLASVNNGTLILRGKEVVSIPTAHLERVQQSLGRRRLDGSIIAFPFGAILGGAAGWLIGHNMRGPSDPRGSQPSVGLAIGAAVGGGLAALIGAEFAPERWKDIKIR